VSATSITTAQPAPATSKRTFKRRYSAAQGNAIQATGMAAGAALLAASASLSGPALVRTLAMLTGFIAVYMNCHSIAHYGAGRLVGLDFRG